VLDCAGLTFVDSSGLSALLTQTKITREAGGSIALANVAAPVARVFALAGLDGVFDFEPNTTGATTP
jgi:anti-anti-sigma factor